MAVLALSIFKNLLKVIIKTYIRFRKTGLSPPVSEHRYARQYSGKNSKQEIECGASGSNPGRSTCLFYLILFLGVGGLVYTI